MSTHNICFHREIGKIPLLSTATVYKQDDIISTYHSYPNTMQENHLLEFCFSDHKKKKKINERAHRTVRQT